MKTMWATLIHIFDPYRKRHNEGRSSEAGQAQHVSPDQLVVDHRGSGFDGACQLLFKDKTSNIENK
jgi:hypothetical protein